jgi:hypothetical protein
MIHIRTVTYVGMLFSAYTVGKLALPVVAVSPYMLFLALFTEYWGWAKTFVIHFCVFVFNESLPATSLVPGLIHWLQGYWTMAYLGYFMFTLLEVYAIKWYLVSNKHFTRIINL